MDALLQEYTDSKNIVYIFIKNNGKILARSNWENEKETPIEDKNIEIKEKSLSKIMPTETVPKSSIELNRGFTIVGKPKEQKLKHGFNHNFYTLKSEFDEIIDNQKEDLT